MHCTKTEDLSLSFSSEDSGLPKRTRTIAATVSEEPDSDLPSLDWAEIEARIGVTVALPLREQISDITHLGRLLVAAQAAELPAPEVKKSVQLILRSLPNPEEIERIVDRINSKAGGKTDAEARADHLLQHAVDLIDDAIGRSGELFSLIARGHHDVVKLACSQVIQRLQESRKQEIGFAWRQWVLEVAHQTSAVIPAHARKDHRLFRGTSPFVYLISELQKVFPKDHRRSEHSLEALSQEVSRTLRLRSSHS
jgi:hypothetical protein